MPVEHWLSKFAKNQGIEVYWRRKKRRQLVDYRAEIAVKMRDDGEKDDLDLESLADKEAIAASRSMHPDEAMEREEREEAARRLARDLEQSEDRATPLIRRRYIEGASYEQMAAEEHATCSICALG